MVKKLVAEPEELMAGRGGAVHFERISLKKLGSEVIIGQGVLEEAGRFIKEIYCREKGKNNSRILPGIAVISPPGIAGYHLAPLTGGLEKEGFHCEYISFPDGEKVKSYQYLERLHGLLLKKRFNRSSLILVMGGGTIGDLAGFAAATYMRGVDFIFIPSSLLAQVDASIGGKVAINHPLGKNTVGVFRQPKLVLVDPCLLKTLPAVEFLNGMAEVIKHSLIASRNYFCFLVRERDRILEGISEIVTEMISRSIRIKSGIVLKDEKESGLRRILNFGHTLGHALESISNYRLHHGYAVAAGMSFALFVSEKLGCLSHAEATGALSLIRSFGLPATVDELYNANMRKKEKNGGPDFLELRKKSRLSKIKKALLYDKKNDEDGINFVILERTGRAAVRKLPLAAVEGYLEEWLAGGRNQVREK